MFFPSSSSHDSFTPKKSVARRKDPLGICQGIHNVLGFEGTAGGARSSSEVTRSSVEEGKKESALQNFFCFLTAVGIAVDARSVKTMKERNI
jgi:hypothetical protein